jgi:hypothetical protein
MKTPYLLLALAAQPLFAATLPQPTLFTESNAGSLYQGTGMSDLVNPGYFNATLEPFNTSLGTLQSFTIKCQLDGQLSGSVGGEGESGAVQASMGGTFLIDGNSFYGTGGGGGSLDDVFFTGQQIDVPFTIAPMEYTLLASDAGGMFNPAILSTITGSSPFTLSFTSGVKVQYLNVADLSASFNSTITLVYNYDTAAGSESLKIVNLIRNGTQQTVSIEWTSAEGKTYAIDASSDLSTNSWSEIQAGLPALTGSATTTFTEQNVSATIPRRFYRVREEE